MSCVGETQYLLPSNNIASKLIAWKYPPLLEKKEKRRQDKYILKNVCFYIDLMKLLGMHL